MLSQVEEEAVVHIAEYLSSLKHSVLRTIFGFSFKHHIFDWRVLPSFLSGGAAFGDPLARCFI